MGALAKRRPQRPRAGECCTGCKTAPTFCHSQVTPHQSASVLLRADLPSALRPSQPAICCTRRRKGRRESAARRALLGATVAAALLLAAYTTFAGHTAFRWGLVSWVRTP